MRVFVAALVLLASVTSSNAQHFLRVVHQPDNSTRTTIIDSAEESGRSIEDGTFVKIVIHRLALPKDWAKGRYFSHARGALLLGTASDEVTPIPQDSSMLLWRSSADELVNNDLTGPLSIQVFGPTYYTNSSSLRFNFSLFAIGSNKPHEEQVKDANLAVSAAENLASAFVPFGSTARLFLPAVNARLVDILVDRNKDRKLTEQTLTLDPDAGSGNPKAPLRTRAEYIVEIVLPNDSSGERLTETDWIDSTGVVRDRNGTVKPHVGYVEFGVEMKPFVFGFDELALRRQNNTGFEEVKQGLDNLAKLTHTQIAEPLSKDAYNEFVSERMTDALERYYAQKPMTLERFREFVLLITRHADDFTQRDANAIAEIITRQVGYETKGFLDVRSNVDLKAFLNAVRAREQYWSIPQAGVPVNPIVSSFVEETLLKPFKSEVPRDPTDDHFSDHFKERLTKLLADGRQANLFPSEQRSVIEFIRNLIAATTSDPDALLQRINDRNLVAFWDYSKNDVRFGTPADELVSWYKRELSAADEKSSTKLAQIVIAAVEKASRLSQDQSSAVSRIRETFVVRPDPVLLQDGNRIEQWLQNKVLSKDADGKIETSGLSETHSTTVDHSVMNEQPAAAPVAPSPANGPAAKSDPSATTRSSDANSESHPPAESAPESPGAVPPSPSSETKSDPPH